MDDATSSEDTDAGARPDELVVRALKAGERLHDIADEISALSAQRQASVRDLRDRFGWTHKQVADALGVSRGQAQNIYEGRRSGGRQNARPDRGDATVTHGG